MARTWLSLIAIACLGGTCLAAQDANERRVEGIVMSVEGTPLHNVDVHLGRDLVATTDPSGRFEVRVPPGYSVLRFTLDGYHPGEMVVGLDADPSPLEIELIPLDRVVESIIVNARREMRVIQREASINFRNREDLERSAAASAADAVEGAPSVTIRRNRGEADDIFIRGMEPRLISTMIDGERIPAPDGDDRTAGIFMIPPELIEAIEVQTTFTPETDGDLIGGSVNLLTRKTPAAGFGRLSLGGGVDHLSGGALREGALTLARRFAGGRLGALASFSANRADRADEQLEIGYEHATTSRSDLRFLESIRDRAGALARLDFAPSLRSDLTAKILLSEFEHSEQRQNIRYDPGRSTIERQFREGTVQKRVDALDLAGIHVLPSALRVSWRLGYFEAKESTPEQFDVSFLWEDGELDGGEPIWLPADLDEFFLDDLAIESAIARDRNLLATLDFARPLVLSGGASTEIRAGARFRRKDKSQDVSRLLFESDADIPLLDYLAERSGRRVVAGHAFGPTIDGGLARDIVDRFGLEGVRSLAADAADYDAHEDSDAAYALMEWDTGSGLSLIAGARYEKTASRYSGFEVVDDDGVTVTPVSGSRSYGVWTPSVLLAKKLGEATTVKAGLSHTFARPDYIHLVPFSQVDEDDLEIERGNPDLHLTTAWNADLSLEWQPSDATELAVAVYLKQIDDFVFESRTNGKYDDRIFTVIRPENGREAELVGCDLSVRKRPRGSSLRDGFHYEASLTLSESRATIPTRPGESIQFPGHSDLSGALTIGWAVDRSFLGVSGSFVSEQLLEIGATRDSDRWADESVRVDFFLTAPLAKCCEFVLRGNNLTNETVRLYEGDRSRPTLIEVSGWSVSAAIRASL